MSKPTYDDVVSLLPTSLRKSETALGVTFNTGKTSSFLPINKHNEQQLILIIPSFFKTLSSLVHRSLSYFLIIEHHPNKSAYQVHCHGVTSDLSLNEIKLAKILWRWHYNKENFANPIDKLTVNEFKKYRVKIENPHLHIRKNSGVSRTINYALKECDSINQVTTIVGTSYCDIRENQKWYSEAKTIAFNNTSRHWIELLNRKVDTSTVEFMLWGLCYLIMCEDEEKFLMNTS